MSYRIKVQDIELSQPIPNITGLDGYHQLQCTVRLHGTPITSFRLPVTGDYCAGQDILETILEKHNWAIVQYLLEQELAAPLTAEPLRYEAFLDTPPIPFDGPYPLVTVAVCTRDRTDNLSLCLESLMQLDYPALDILIVDNAPQTDATERLVEQYPTVRYACEPRPGLDWARNRAILEARGEIITFTDDDVVVDPGWVRALAQVFVENPEAMCVTGLTVPYEIETEAQYLLELYGGFGRGFSRKWFRADIENGEETGFGYGGAGRYGAGANMAFRRSIFDEIGLFDPALDVGTVTNGGGDLEIFFRVLNEGYTLVYEPSMLVRHRHRREYDQLWKQIHNNGIGLYAYFDREIQHYPNARAGFKHLGRYWLRWWNARRLVISLFRPTLFPRDLIWAELKGSVIGILSRRYRKAQRRAVEIEAQFGPQVVETNPPAPAPLPTPNRTPNAEISIRTLDLTQPLPDMADAAAFNKLHILVTLGSRTLGMIVIHNKQQPISVMRLRHEVVSQLHAALLIRDANASLDSVWTPLHAAMNARYSAVPHPAASERGRLPDHVRVSVIVGTYDRPNDLQDCLQALTSQRTNRPVEIIVSDNHPESGLTPPVVARFAGVRLVSESRKGASFARNAGICAASGEIIVTTDDDIIMPDYWLENLVAPFNRSDVMMVTGNFMPPELKTPAQQAFASYDNMGRGHQKFEVDGGWFESFRRRAVRTWELGGTGNAAYRAELFQNPKIGLMEEILGAGVPTGTGEDIYLFYKVLKAGYIIVYEPSAYVWHKYRSDMAAFKRQIYNYSKGHIAYHLLTIARDGDWRGLVQILYVLPRWRIQQIFERVVRHKGQPLSITWQEIKGNLAGPWSLWQAKQHVRRENRKHTALPMEANPPLFARQDEERQSLP
ncbi:MAG: glycosyltransferase [Anaerolineaceae bacterium]|nr:glycosyltransferase [Anaerolineaceae bacterium]